MRPLHRTSHDPVQPARLKRLAARLLPFVACGGLLHGTALAHDRLMREFDERNGLWVSEIMELAQDSAGFLWIGTSGGLVRFDGREMQAWAPLQIHHVVRAISCAPGGRTMVAAVDLPLLDVTLTGVDTIPGPNGRAIGDWVHASYDRSGRLWVARADTLEWRDTAGHWRALSSSAFDSSRFYRVRPWRGDTVFVATNRALWRMNGDGRRERVASLPRVQDVAELPGGRVAVATRAGELDELEPHGTRLIYRGKEGCNAMVARGGVLWATIDRYVLRFAPGAAPDTIAPTLTTPNGRPLLVDHEGSLWLGGYHGLIQFPEPETVVWGTADGLPAPPHGYLIHHDAEGAWVTTWFGAVLIPDPAPRRVRPLGLVSGGFYSDGAGDLWWADRERGFMRRHRGVDAFFPRPGVHRVVDAAPRADGTLWLATDDGPFITPDHAGAPRLVAVRPPPGWGRDWVDCWLGAIVLDRRGTLWISRDEEVAHANAESLAAGLPVAWQVEHLEGSFYVEELAEMPSGTLWAGTGEGGMWRLRRQGGFEPIPGSAGLASPRIYGIAPSPAGGLWILAGGSIVRVRERQDLPAGWEVLETLTSWQGAPSRQAGGLAELDDGRIWLASLAGIVEMPAEARRAPRRPPTVQLVEQRVDGQNKPLDRPLVLPYRRNRLELRFAALSYRDPSLLRYQLRVRPNAPWQESREPDFHVVDLAPGRYAVDVRASLDGEHWTEPPTRVRFRVLQPWTREPWAIVLYVLAGATLLLAAHRLRVGVLLRLERQRTRIAMDLHDEMGSGLGSIGILAGLASASNVDEPTRRRLLSEISRAAGELGSALTDLVSALRAGSDTVESFAYRLAERGGRLFPAPPPAFTTEFPPQWPPVHLAFALRRELHLIALEALHNAARHAAARHVTLGLAAQADRWCLWVEDDGRGFPAGALPRGHGIENMERRAAAAGFELRVTPCAGGGTRIEVRFEPRLDPARRDARGRGRITMRGRAPRRT